MMTAQQWEEYANRRLADYRGDTQAAWRDVLGTTALASRLYSSRVAARSLDAAIVAFRRAVTADRRAGR